MEYLRQYMPMPAGVPSVSTMSRILSRIDEEMVSLAVMNWICAITDTRGILGTFFLQVKKNCPLLYEELMDLFDDLRKLKEDDGDAFERVSGETYGEHKTSEKNRERYEHRKVEYYEGKEWIEYFQEERPSIKSVGRTSQVRILVVQDAEGKDVTPSLEEFLANGSIRQPIVTVGDGFKDVVQKAGLVSNRKMSAEEMMKYHRNHWTIEDSLHYVLDETFGEDKCTVKKGKMHCQC